jgi:hypothetical protein
LASNIILSALVTGDAASSAGRSATAAPTLAEIRTVPPATESGIPADRVAAGGEEIYPRGIAVFSCAVLGTHHHNPVVDSSRQ